MPACFRKSKRKKRKKNWLLFRSKLHRIDISLEATNNNRDKIFPVICRIDCIYYYYSKHDFILSYCTNHITKLNSERKCFINHDANEGEKIILCQIKEESTH